MCEDQDRLLSQMVIEQPPSCIKFCPSQPSLFVVGTYKLEDGKENACSDGSNVSGQSRSGRVELYQIRKRANASHSGLDKPVCIDKCEFLHCAILDLHFDPQDGSCFAICTSTSRLVIFRLVKVKHGSRNESIQISKVKVVSLQPDHEPTILATSFAWNPKPFAKNDSAPSFAVTFSSGEVRLVDVDLSGGIDAEILAQTSIYPCHTLEAWTVAFAEPARDAANKRLLLTGGDDSMFTVNMITHDSSPGQLKATQLFRDRKSHDAGVIAILPIPNPIWGSSKRRAFVTGSYDEHMRIYTIDEDVPLKTKMEASLALGGGVWRLRTLSGPFRLAARTSESFCILILASCMHGGVRIVRVICHLPKRDEDGHGWEANVVGRFTKGHESMCYGADSVALPRLAEDVGDDLDEENYSHKDRDFVVASTSFYDKKICLWTFSSDDGGSCSSATPEG
jgi:diphthine methyl ester acylhydrolase